MATRDVRGYFKSQPKNGVSQPLLLSASNTITPAEMNMVNAELKEATKPRTQYNKKVPDRIKTEVGTYAHIHGTKAALEKFGKKYPHYKFIRNTVNHWKCKAKQSNTTVGKSGSGRPNLLSEDTLKKVKDIIIGTRTAGGVISRRMVIAIGIGVVKANDPNILKEYGGQVELTEGWARGVLSTLD